MEGSKLQDLAIEVEAAAARVEALADDRSRLKAECDRLKEESDRLKAESGDPEWDPDLFGRVVSALDRIQAATNFEA